jgi:sulfonate transport system permease protein
VAGRCPRIVVREVTKTFRDGGREVAAVAAAGFEVLDQEFIAVVGPSGCGKSTIIVFFNTFQGARSVDADLINSARFLGATERQIVRTVIVPSALAWTFASLTPSISFALIGVVGEFLGGESGGGLGYLIIQSLGTLNAADMMVALLSLGVIGIAMALVIKQVERRLLRWRPEYRARA